MSQQQFFGDGGSPSFLGIETITGDDSVAVSGTGTPVNVNLQGGIGIRTSGDNTLHTEFVEVITDGFDWAEVSSDTSVTPQTAQVCTGSLTIDLPPTTGLPSGDLVLGDTVIIYVDTGSTVTIQANTGQFIQIGENVSISGGTATSAISTSFGTMIKLFFRKNDLTWHATSSVGTWNVQTSP